MITRDKANLITNDVLAALGEVAKKHSVTFSNKGGSYSTGNVTMRLEAAEVNPDGTVNSRNAQTFKTMAPMYGLKPEWLNGKFLSGGLEYTIIGLNTRRSKNPVECRQTKNQKIYIFKADSIQRLMTVGNVHIAQLDC